MPMSSKTEGELLALIGFGPGAVVNLISSGGEVVGTAKVADDGSIPVDGVQAFAAIESQSGERIDLPASMPPSQWMTFTGALVPRITDC